MSDLKKLVAQFMSELAKFEATTAQEPIAADEFSPEELADLTKVRNMGAKIRAKIAATAKPNAEIPKLEAVPFPQPEDSPQMTEAGNDEVQTKGGGGVLGVKVVKLDIEGCMPRTVIFQTPNGEELGKISIKPGDEEPFCWTTKLDPKKLFVMEPITVENASKLKIIARIEGINKAQKVVKQRKEISFDHLAATTVYPSFTVEIRWFGDGEKEFAIMINGKTTKEESKKAYWKDAQNVLAEVQDETGSTFSEEDALFLDGNTCDQVHSLGVFDIDKAMSAEFRSASGAADAKEQAPKIFAKLKKDPNTGKIVQRIQVFTHSRGSVYGNMFVAQLQDEIKKNAHLFADPDNVIDIVLHLDPHQPEFIDVQPAKHPTIVVDHDNSLLGGIEGIKGDVYAMETKDELMHIKPGNSHKIGTYAEEVDKVLDQHNKNGQNNTSNKYDGFKEAFKDQIIDERPPTK